MASFWIYIRRLIVYLYRFPDKFKFSDDKALILMFHHVTDEKVEASPSCLCSVNNFLNVLEYLKRNHIKVVSIDEALSNMKKKIFRGYAVITFDDGINDTFKVAYPLLKNRNLPFTVYITFNYLNKEGYLLTEQLNILNNDPLCTLGAHTLNHHILINAKNAKEEIVQSKLLLETLIKKEVLHFAYPYGGPYAVSLENIFDTKGAGFKTAVSTIDTRLNYFSTLTKFYLPRINGSFFFTTKTGQAKQNN